MRFLLYSFFAVAVMKPAFALNTVNDLSRYTHRKCELSDGSHVVSPIHFDEVKIELDAEGNKHSSWIPVPECAPEVLYFWRPLETVREYAKQSTPSKLLPFQDAKIFTWRTPIGSFGYGDFVVRVKLKPHLHYYWNQKWNHSGGCDVLSDEEKKNTVIFDFNPDPGNFSEYNICSSDVVESWSYGTPEIYTEMENEYQWIKKHYDHFIFYDRYYKTDPNAVAFDTSTFLKFTVDTIYGARWDEEKLLENFQKLKKIILTDQQPHSFYSGGEAVNSEEDPYAVKYPDYFNIQKLKVRPQERFDTVVVMSKRGKNTCLFQYGSSMDGSGSGMITRDLNGFLHIYSGNPYEGWGKIWISEADQPVHEAEGLEENIDGALGGARHYQTHLKIDPFSIQLYLNKNYEGAKGIRELCDEEL